MKLDVWKEAIDLLRLTNSILKKIRVDFRLQSQILNAVQSVSSNIGEGYGRRTINEYLQFLRFSLGSSAESLSRMTGLLVTGYISRAEFDGWDERHYSMENKLLGLIRSLEAKRRDGTWSKDLPAGFTER